MWIKHNEKKIAWAMGLAPLKYMPSGDMTDASYSGCLKTKKGTRCGDLLDDWARRFLLKKDYSSGVKRLQESTQSWYWLKYAQMATANAFMDGPVMMINSVGNLPPYGNRTHPNSVAARVIHRAFTEIACGDVAKLKKEYNIVKKLVMQQSDHVGLANDKSFKEYITKAKKLYSMAVSSITTARNMETMQENYVTRQCSPGPTFAKQAALHNYLNNAVSRLTNSQLVLGLHIIMDHMTDGATEIDNSIAPDKLSHKLNDTNMINLLGMFYFATRGRYYTKPVNVAPEDCTCHAKCTGRSGGSEVVEDVFGTVFKSMGTKICPKTRISLLLKTKTKEKPKQYIDQTDPGRLSCSLDGCDAELNLELYTLKRDTDTTESREVKYKHLYYCSKTACISQSVYEDVISPTSAILYGMCINGRRTCMKMRTFPVNSAKQYNTRHDFENGDKHFKCASCPSVKYDSSKHTFFSEPLHRNTCIELHLTDPDAELCIGCKAATLCRHAFNGALAYITATPPEKRNTKILFNIISLQNKIRSQWNSNPNSNPNPNSSLYTNEQIL